MKGKPSSDRMRTGGLGTGQTLPTFPRCQKNTSNRSGTWIKQSSPQKMNVQENSALKEGQLALAIDSMLNGVDMSDLNTPDIKFEDFDFLGGKATSSYRKSNVNVEKSPAAQASTISVDSSHGEEVLSIKAQASDSAYAFFDMSPGTRDLLQTVSPSVQEDLHADQHEQRINIEQYQDPLATTEQYQDHLVSTNEEIILPNITELDQYMPDDFDTMGSLHQPDQIEMPALHNSPPQISITEDDSEFSIPKDVLEAIDEIFPNLTPSDNVCTYGMDLMLGQNFTDPANRHTGSADDLLSESMQQSGIFEDELESFGFEDESSVHNPLLQPGSLVSNISDIQASNFLINEVANTNTFVLKEECPETSMNVKSSEATLHYGKNISTPIVQKPSSSKRIPKTPVKKRQLQQNTTPLSQPTVKRQRRASRKPLRFRELYTDGDTIDSEPSESSGNSESRLRYDASDEEIESIDVTAPITSGNITKGAARASVEGLTEEQKYHRIRILNNEASKRCRLKRKATVKEMQKELIELEERNMHLRNKHEALKQLKDKFQVFVTDYFKKQLGTTQNR